MPCPFKGPKMFCAGPNFLSQPKNLTAFSASSKTFVPAQKPILLNANYLFVWHKKFGPAQNILGPVKGQGISNTWTAKDLFTYFASHKHFVSDKKKICIH